MSADCLFEALASRQPDAAIFQGAEDRWSQGRVQQGLAALGERLAECRVLAILADNSPQWAVADLAALQTGTPALPLPLFFAPSQLAHALEQTGADAVLTDQPERILSLNLGFAPDGAWGGLLWLRRSQPRHCTGIPAGTAKVSFTSGSTGTPKGVCLSIEGLLDTARSLQSRLSDLGVQRHLAVMPLSLLLENSAGIYATLLRGAEIHLPGLASLGWQGMSGFNPQALQQTVAALRPHTVIVVPELLKAWTLFLARTGQAAPDSLLYVAVGGSRVESRLLAQARSLGLPAYQGYGLTECGSVVSINRPGDDGDGVGRVLPHVRVEIKEGEIYATTRAFLGYLGDPPVDGAAYPTGDLGYFDRAGYLHLSGRRKNLLITSYGRNISPEWVEAALLARPEISQAVVAGDARPVLAAIVVPFPGVSAAVLDAAIRAANAELPDYARIGHWITAPPFTPQGGLLTGNGRPVRAAILEHYAAEMAALYHEKNEEYEEASANVIL